MSDLADFTRDLERLVERLVEQKVDERLRVILQAQATVKPSAPQQEWVDYHEAAELLGVTYGTLRGWVANNRYRIRELTKGEGRMRRFHRPSLESFDTTKRAV